MTVYRPEVRLSGHKSQPRIAVVVATRDRAALLADRALPSVVAQTRIPDDLIVVDDSSLAGRLENRTIVSSLNLPDVRIRYLENGRTTGASGSWNTAIDLLHHVVDDPAELFLAFLDDDDAWAPDYLERCVALACDQGLDMVAADIERIEGQGHAPTATAAPESLCGAEFLTGNPGIQGSNLFVRLSVLLAAGCFDEGLRSTTDRDLCIRIADLGTVHYGRLASPLVRHFADTARARLSTRGSDAKLDGLTAFWLKYIGRMTATQRQAFCDRAWALFDWRPGSASGEPIMAAPGSRERVAAAELRVKQMFALDSPRLLGCGSEGVVFTDERTVYKCIDHWHTTTTPAQLQFLHGQIGRWRGVPGLYALREVIEDGPSVVLTYDYEPSVPYRGGHEGDLIGLLAGCRRVGVVCNNLHPKNLVVTAAGVKLIDYGSDIRPWTPLGYEHMALRAFLTCKHADSPELRSLMRRALRDPHLPELAGFAGFREKMILEGEAGPTGRPTPEHELEVHPHHDAPPHEPFTLYVGIISADPMMLRTLLGDLAALRSLPSIARWIVVVLENGGPGQEFRRVVQDAGLEVALVSEEQQRRDAVAGAFGELYHVRPRGQVGIAQARTMLQRYLGGLLSSDGTSFAWILDEDMRVDGRARVYLPWLPAFRRHGVHVLLGQYEGSSPNPPLNGVRVQLVDLLHNLVWLAALDHGGPLPDRSAENRVLRAKYPDYYYDLSRLHTGHLELPHWVEPAFQGETVSQAHARLVAGAVGILSGAPLTRPLLTHMPAAPLAAAQDSVNRGGCTFVLDHRALTLTPNVIVRVGGREARRSDMMWALLNRYYRGLSIKRVDFPVLHVGRVTRTPDLNLEKVTGELVGAAFYGALTEFLRHEPHHGLEFSRDERATVSDLVGRHMDRRLLALDLSFHRIRGLKASLSRLSSEHPLNELTEHLDHWFTPHVFASIRAQARNPSSHEFDVFLASLPRIADDYARATVRVGFVQDQLHNHHQPAVKIQ